MTRHFLRDDDLSPAELLEVLDLADRLKAEPFDHKPLAGPRTVALVFDRPTLRTQVSFAAGIAELGGNPMTVDGGLAAMGSREGVEDVARIPADRPLPSSGAPHTRATW
jgi:ornithine carbamoyltransferase